MRVEFHPTASEEFEVAAAYYGNEVLGRGAACISEVERISELIQEHPAIGQPIDEVFRSAVLLRFLSFTVLRWTEFGLLLSPIKGAGQDIGVVELVANLSVVNFYSSSNRKLEKIATMHLPGVTVQRNASGATVTTDFGRRVAV